MNKKEILMICLIICFIFSLQAVSAADVDVNTTDDTILTVQTDDAVSISNDLSSYSLSDDDSIVRGENDGAGSFSELQERINNDTTGTISLDKNYAYNSSSDAGLTNGIVISKDIVIRGNDFTIDAISSARIFNITTGSTVTLTGINFVNGGSTSVTNGGSIYTSAEGLLVDNCTFKNSYAAKDGGAIYVNADHCTVANSTFTDNIAGDDGAALCWNGDAGTIYNITCVNNKGISSDGSTSKGGSICLTGDDVTVDKSTFTDSSATYNGGALFVTGDNVNITNCDFSKCTSDITATPNADDLPYGGAMYIIGNNALVDTCTFDDCEAIYGGAIYVLGDSAKVDHSTFTNNNATKDGGAIYVDGEDCVVANSTFTNNIVGDDGGALYWNGARGTIYNINCTNNRGISSGTSTSKGGSICLTGDDTSIDKSTFTDSSATYNGGALFITGDNVNITNCDFSKCTSDTSATPSGDDLPYGGAMYILGNNTLVDTCTFDDCEAINGGAIYVLGDSAIINNSTFTNDEATKDGGAIYIDGKKCIVHNSTFTDNVAGDDGGAIYWNGAQGNIYNITCANNRGISSGTSTSKGGTICLTGDDTVIDKSTFTDSFATFNGGALFITGDNVNITNCNFSSCTSDTSATPSGDDLPYGGAMYIIGSDTLVDTCTFEDCEAINGGTVYITGDRATIKNSNISDSTAKVGGAIYIDGVDTTIIDSSFKDNYAKSGSSYTTDNLGGAIYIKGNRATINGSEFESSGAYQGGAIYLAGDYCTVNASTFNDSYAYLDGGAMYSTGSYSNVTDSNFTSNIARGNGGAIYWYGGTKSKYNTVDGCMFLENVVYAANFASNTRGGGAVYWSDNGDHGTIKNSQFINNSVQSSDKADGGAILWDRSNHALIDNCVFDGNYITTSNSGNVWVQGGALYLRADSEFIINNSVFKNSVSDKEAGALYAQTKNGLTDRIIINNTSFINNVAKAFGQNSFGGGAVQVKECDNVHFYNVLFINNTANNGGAVSAYKARTKIDFYNCTFEGNNATDNGGAVWTDSAIDLQDDEFYNNTANLGGGFYVNKNNLNIHDLTFINNTAELGGGIYIAQGGASLTNLNMTDNKAFSGSAIYSTVAFKIINSYLIENQANSSSLTFDTYNEGTGEIVILFKGKDKYLNAIYITNSNRPTCTNVTYWNENGEANTGSSATTLPNAADPTPEAGQNITVRVYDDAGNLLNPDQQYFITDKYGKIHLDLHDLVPNVPEEKYNEIYVEAELTNDDYYTIIKLTSRLPSEVNASADKTKYHLNSTVYVNVTSGATGNVSVYLNDTFLGNISLDHSTGSMNISTLIEGKYLPVGNHTLSFIYNGNAKYDKSNTTAILEIEKITPTMLINVTSLGYNLIVNVTVMDGEYGIADATGNVTIQVEGRTATIFLGNSQGMTIIYGLPSGNYTVNATYNGDNNYYNVTNSTDANITEKTITALVIEVDNEKIYYINETVPIKVNILPEGEGNITLYINGEPHVLPLITVNNETFAEFNATELKDGTNYIFATYNGTELYAPSWDEDHFNVIKYNSTVLISTTNITRGETEVINITVPDDATGILNVTVNGTSYFVEIIDGTASVPISGLNVGVYNVTVRFNEDKKYYNSTNSTLFNVSQAKPTIIIDVDNVTYGNETVIVVTLPEDATGNVTVKINDTYYVFDTQNLTDGKATMPGIILPAGNYTVEATYNGDENYTVNTNSTNFTVYKAKPVLNITVEDIYYGEEANITVTVPDGVTGNITIKINGTDKNITLPIVDGKVNWTVSGLAVGNCVVIANYSGNANYTNATVTDGFNVLQIGTVLDVDVHDIPVWDTEYINITIKDAAGNIITNATGNVTININGVNHTAEIKNGIARFNTSDLAVGHKVVWVFYDGDTNLTGNRSMAEFDVTQRNPKVNVTALNVTVDQATTITINIPANATGFVVLSGNFTKRPIYVDAEEFTNGVAEVIVDDLAVGKYSVHIKYYGDALDNYTTAENDTTFTVGKINATVSIEAHNVTYGNATTIVVTVPEGVTGNITLKLNDTNGRNITLPIENGKVTWTVEGLAAGNYTVNATYNGNDDYNINDTESAKFEVKKADPGLDFIVSGTVNENATVEIYINDEIHGKVVNVTVDGVLYPNVSVDEEFITQVLTEIKPYTIIVEYGGNENFTDARVEHTFTPPKVTNYGINVTAMNITVGEDEIITVEVPDNVDDVVIWVDGKSYRNNSFTDNKATFNITGLKEGVYTVTAYVNDTEFEHINFTTLFTVNKTYPSINITVVNETSIYVNDTVKVIVTVPSDATEDVTIEINGMKYTNSTVDGNATFYIPEI
uniref:Ig-like domain repeat protein n=1 Tax=Methanobrevibacter sp. TaxID=66852 RepID=UPI003868E6C8